MILNEEQAYLADTVKAVVNEYAPVAKMRELRESADAHGFDQAFWQKLIEMGIPATTIPEAYDGLAFGYLGLGAAFEQMGRNLAASPLLTTAVLAASAIELAGSESIKKELLPKIAAGELIATLAIDEKPHHDPAGTAATLTEESGSFCLSGRKVFVIDGNVADLLIVVARSTGEPDNEEGLTLVLVDPKKEGVGIDRTIQMDGRNAAIVTFDGVELSGADILGAPGQAWNTLQQVLDRGSACLAAEMLGGAQEVFDRTIEYLRERVQFGVRIGSFQALQHRASQMFCELELCRSAVLDALNALDENAEDRAERVSTAKALANDCYQHITNEGVQLHGGMGMTEELDMGLFLKRARVSMQTLGDSNYHRDRFARLKGY